MCGEKCYGLPPFKIIEKKLINLSGDLRTDVSHYLLECCNSLSVVGLLPALILDTLQMAVSCTYIQLYIYVHVHTYTHYVFPEQLSVMFISEVYSHSLKDQHCSTQLHELLDLDVCMYV